MSIHETITNKIVNQIESGILPWKNRWGSETPTMVRPLRANGTPYKGINTLILWVTSLEFGYSGNHWMTFNQAKSLGGHVRKGERASEVVFFKTLELEDEETDDKKRKVPMLNTYKVFNVDQCEGLPEKYLRAKSTTIEVPGLPDSDRILTADAWIDRVGADLRIGGNRAYFAPDSDHVQMPEFSRFISHDAYYATILHELTHWSGGKSRLNRDLNNRFGSNKYAAEELIAELGAAFLCSDLGIVDTDTIRDDHASYIESWLKVLKGDSKAIFTAAAKAEQACKYLQDKALEAAASEPQQLKLLIA